MFKKIGATLCLIVVSLLGYAVNANAQVVSTPVPTANAPDSIIVSFPGVIVKIDGGAPPDVGGDVSTPTISFKQGASQTILTSKATLFKNSRGSAQIILTDFQTLINPHAVNLVTGSATVPGVAPGKDRRYLIIWDNVQLDTQSQAEPVITVAVVGSSVNNPPVFFINNVLDSSLQDRQKKLALNADGVNLAALVAKFKTNPGTLKAVFSFDRNDPVPGTTNNSITEEVVGLEGVRRERQDNGKAKLIRDDAAPQFIIITLARELPQRPEPYTVKLEFAIADLNTQGLLKTGFAAPVQDEPLTASERITRPPPSTERAKTEFFFETTFTSIVNATNRKRSNVGLFGLHFKPVIGLRFFNVGTPLGQATEQADAVEEDKRKPKWIAFRPLFDADVDTQPIKNSQAPNRIVFGADFEYGIAASRKGLSDLVQQYVFLNGVRYDSDRDFKVQTIYWQTEFLPQFLNFDVTREQRLRQFRRPCDPELLAKAIARGESTALTPAQCMKIIKDKSRLFPVVSTYYVRPSVGYQLGGTIKKGDSDSDTISRLFVKFGAGVEFRRLIALSLDDTYYFLQDADRRRNRNYLETRLDVNTGALFNVDLGTLQSAITFKFQRGELPPRFKPVNAFSIGFKLYR